jgi:hypothetical protein
MVGGGWDVAHASRGLTRGVELDNVGFEPLGHLVIFAFDCCLLGICLDLMRNDHDLEF